MLGRVYHHARPWRIFDIPVFLTIKRVGLVERDRMPALRQGPDNSAIIRRSSVPISGHQAGSKKGNIKLLMHGRLEAPVDPFADRKQLIDSVAASMPCQDGSPSVRGQITRHVRVVQ